MKKAYLKLMTIFLMFVSIVLLIGFININVFDYYEVPYVDTAFLKNQSDYILFGNWIINDEDCEGTLSVDIYKTVDYENVDYDFYIAVISVNIDMNDDLSTQTLSEFDSIESISIRYDMSSENDYNLANYTQTDWGARKVDFDISFSWNNFVGKKSINESLNKVGYTHTNTSTAQKVYQGNFKYYDYTEDSNVRTMVVISVKKDEAFSFNFDYKVEMKHTELSAFSIEKSDITGDWKRINLSN